MNGRLDECVIKIATNQMSLYRRVCIYICVCYVFFFTLYLFIDGHERKNRIPSKNHQSTFTAITADTRTRTRKICADTMTVTAMTKAIVYLGLNYIFIRFFFRLSFSFPPTIYLKILHHFCYITDTTIRTKRKTD